MIKFVFKPKRRVNGKCKTARLYSGRYKLGCESKPHTVRLKTSDKQVAEQRLNEIVSEREKESAGILAPKIERESASRPLKDHLSDYLRDLTAKRRDREYVYTLEARNLKLQRECDWKYLKDITADSFISWRSKQNKSAVTLNQYRDSVSGFLNWLVENRRTALNPLVTVGSVDEAGEQVRPRRAYTDEQMQKLLAVAGQWRIGYLTAVHTGLRRAELRALEWQNFTLDGETPLVWLEKAFTKNKKKATLPLHPELANELRRIKPVDALPTDTVFSNETLPSIYVLKKHLMQAGIPYVDESGKRADFHSLRHTLATNLAKTNVQPRMAMELMRHSDIRLTMKTYTDADCLPLKGSINGLPSFLAAGGGNSVPSGGASRSEKDAQIRTQNTDASGQKLSSSVMKGDVEDAVKAPENQGLSRELSLFDIDRNNRQVAASLGFEPRQRDPESLVLPLHYEANEEGVICTVILENARERRMEN